MAGLFKEGRGIPFVFDRDLRQQEAAAAVLADEEAVASNFNGFGKNWLRRGENAQLDFEVRSFVGGDGREAIVVEGGRAGSFGDGAVEGSGGKSVADAAAQFAGQVQRSEDATHFGEVRSRRFKRDRTTFESGRNGVMSQT